jgi:hypothetical protein
MTTLVCILATEVQSIAAHQEEAHHLIEKPPFS